MWITVRAVKLMWHTPKMSIKSQRFQLYSIYRLLVQFSFFLYLVHHVELEYIYIYGGVSYNINSAGDGGSIRRLQMYIGDTSANWGQGYVSA